MITLGIVLGITALLALDLWRGLNLRDKVRLEFRFSRYNMYDQRPGRSSFEMSPAYYNLAKPVEVLFDVKDSGYLDPIREADVLFMGGSAAFGIGSGGNERNVTGVLRAKHGIDVVNLAACGYNVAQEVITILRHLDRVRPKKIVLFDGANDMAFSLPTNYFNQPFPAGPGSFYEEHQYGRLVDEHLRLSGGFSFTLNKLLARARKRFVTLAVLYRIRAAAKQAAGGEETFPDRDLSAEHRAGMSNYVHWVEILSNVCKERGIELIVATQPYYLFGRDRSELGNARFPRVNEPYDRNMLAMFGRLDEMLAHQAGIRYLPLFKTMAKEEVNLFVDAVHLSDRGYEFVADQLASVLKV